MPCQHVCMYTVYAWYPQRPEEDIGSPGTGVTDGCEPPCGSWKLNLGPLDSTAIACNCWAISPAPLTTCIIWVEYYPKEHMPTMISFLQLSKEFIPVGNSLE